MKSRFIKGLRLLVLAAPFVATHAYAQVPAFVPDAETAPRGHGQVALLAPSRIGLSERVEFHTVA